MIRIISGTYKGRYLKLPNSKVTRPTMDKVRQAIFSAIKEKVFSKTALDLFAGSGAMGLEALSRGTSFCFFNDKDRKTFEVLKENIKELDIPKEKYEAYCMDYRLFLKKTKDVQFDLVFLDPPYRFDINEEIILSMDKNKQLSEDALIVSEKESPCKDVEGFEKKEYRYGEKHVGLYYRKGE